MRILRIKNSIKDLHIATRNVVAYERDVGKFLKAHKKRQIVREKILPEVR